MAEFRLSRHSGWLALLLLLPTGGPDARAGAGPLPLDEGADAAAAPTVSGIDRRIQEIEREMKGLVDGQADRAIASDAESRKQKARSLLFELRDLQRRKKEFEDRPVK